MFKFYSQVLYKTHPDAATMTTVSFIKDRMKYFDQEAGGLQDFFILFYAGQKWFFKPQRKCLVHNVCFVQ